MAGMGDGSGKGWQTRSGTRFGAGDHPGRLFQSSGVEWSRSYPRIRGMDAKPYGRRAAEMTTRVTTTWAEQLKREGTIGRFAYDHAQNLAARGTPGGERPET